VITVFWARSGAFGADFRRLDRPKERAKFNCDEISCNPETMIQRRILNVGCQTL